MYKYGSTRPRPAAICTNQHMTQQIFNGAFLLSRTHTLSLRSFILSLCLVISFACAHALSPHTYAEIHVQSLDEAYTHIRYATYVKSELCTRKESKQTSFVSFTYNTRQQARRESCTGLFVLMSILSDVFFCTSAPPRLNVPVSHWTQVWGQWTWEGRGTQGGRHISPDSRTHVLREVPPPPKLKKGVGGGNTSPLRLGFSEVCILS